MRSLAKSPLSTPARFPIHQRRALQSLVATAFGLAPGMLLPFILTFRLGVGNADVVLVATSLAMTLNNITANCLEQHTMALYGSQIGRGQLPTAKSWRSYRRRVSMITAGVVVVGLPLVATVYAKGMTDGREDFLLALVPLVLVPFLATQSALKSARAVSLGYVSSTILSQAARASVPIAAVATSTTAPVYVYTLAYTIGELLRLTILTFILRRALNDIALPEVSDVLSHQGLPSQMASMLMNQAGPVVDRAILVRSPVGSVAAYEMADKFLFAAVQVLVSGLLLRRFGVWSVIGIRRAADLRAAVIRDVKCQLILSVALGLLMSGTCFWISQGEWLPTAVKRGVLWGSLALLSLPAAVLISSFGRVLVIAGRQKWLVGLTLLNVVLNVGLDVLLFTLIGPVGVVVSSVVARLVTATAYAVVTRRLFRQELAGQDAVGWQSETEPMPPIRDHSS